MLKFTEEVKGHDLIQNQICQALKKKRLPHGLLFSGPSGVGKKKLAWALAKFLLCEGRPLSTPEDSLFLWNQNQNNNQKASQNIEITDSTKDSFLEPSASPSIENQLKACGLCLSCRNVAKKESPSVLEIKSDTLQIKLSDLSSIFSFLSLQSFAEAKIVLIDLAERLNPQASNFLLKTIEEPAPKTFFFLISSQVSQISGTIRSRLQNIVFDPLSDSLMEELSGPETEKWMIKSSRGRMDLLDDLKEKKDLRELAFAFFFDCVQKELPEIDFSGRELSKALKSRRDSLNILKFWGLLLRDLRLLSLFLEEEIINKDYIEKIKRIHVSSKADLDFLLKQILEKEFDLKANVDIKLCFESFIIPMKKILMGS